MVSLNQRLRAALTLMDPAIPRVYDVGFDHGQTLDALRNQGHDPIGIEVAHHLTHAYRRAGGKAPVMAGDGLTMIAGPGQALLCGIGWERCLGILSGAAFTPSRVVIGPSDQPYGLRRGMAANGWRIEAEALALDNGRYVPLTAWERGTEQRLDDAHFAIGPLLPKDPLFEAYCVDLRNRLGAMLAHFEQLPAERRDFLSILA